jgi:hypothetical protein
VSRACFGATCEITTVVWLLAAVRTFFLKGLKGLFDTLTMNYETNGHIFRTKANGILLLATQLCIFLE